ncbi:synaptopodin isoform X1 [Ranitomeya variabilis]|uniref:synaptopodin isoform X1 n=1 Tax=Ranitomeya variabilis TaxID=490064 RepID=UPI0040578415
MMLKSNTVQQSPMNGSIVADGLPSGIIDQNEVEHESWHTTLNEFSEMENNNNNNMEEPRENDQVIEVTTAVWAIVEEESDEPSNGFTKDEEETKSVEAPLKLDPVPIKTGENDLQWKILPNTKVVQSVQKSRKMYIPRSLSLTEKELKEAQLLSDNDASQLSPSGSCSKGAQLFHKRRQRIKAFEEKKLAQQSVVQHGIKLGDLKKKELQFGFQKPSHFYSMEETSTNHGSTGGTDDIWVDETKESDFLPIDKRAPSPSASEEDHQGPLSAYLKETLMVSNSNTNGLVIETNQEPETPVKKEQNGSPNTQYCEVTLTLSKPISVSNRTAKPFGGQSSAKRNVYSSEKSPIIDLPPPPTYAETLSSPPPVSRVRSPPAYSALYPIEPANITPVQEGINYGETRLAPQPKTGILETIAARKGPKKSMFTFIEKPKMAPNPELLSMVQNADERQKHRDHPRELATEDEPFALGAEASNFQNKSPNAANSADQANRIHDWSSSLKSPGLSPKPPLMPVQTLSEDKGKGAELFARRQSRMERFVVENSTPLDSIRSPSPTMSLPPSWKFASKTPPPSFIQPKNNQRSPKLPVSAPVTNTVSESVQAQKELELSKRQPYQLQSSLFILSPTKDPVSSLPKAAPPPKPMVVESHRFNRQTSCPTSPVVPSPSMYSPTYFQSIRSPSSVNMSPSPGPDTPPSYGRRTPTNHASPLSPVPFSNAMVSSPRNKTVIQAPRPTFSAKNAGLESQKPGFSYNRALQHQGSLDGWASSSASLQSYDEGLVIRSPPPPRCMSPAWSDRSQSPSPLRMENDLKGGNQMKALLARNIINAAKRKSTSPWGVTSPQSPIHISTPWSPTIRNGSSLPATPRARRSPTGSDISVESEDSGAKSPGFRSYPFSPRGWYGSLRVKRDSLPSSSPFPYTP